MSRLIFLHLPVASVAESRRFFGALGFTFDEAFSDARCACVQIERNFHVMLLERDFFATFIHGEVAVSPATTESIICLSAASREEVDDTVRRAVAAGGHPWKDSFSEGSMYGGSFADPDGHVWELMFSEVG